jgi:hypothetical protein
MGLGSNRFTAECTSTHHLLHHHQRHRSFRCPTRLRAFALQTAGCRRRKCQGRSRRGAWHIGLEALASMLAPRHTLCTTPMLQSPSLGAEFDAVFEEDKAPIESIVDSSEQLQQHQDIIRQDSGQQPYTHDMIRFQVDVLNCMTCLSHQLKVVSSSPGSVGGKRQAAHKRRARWWVGVTRARELTSG